MTREEVIEGIVDKMKQKVSDHTKTGPIKIPKRFRQEASKKATMREIIQMHKKKFKKA